MRANNAPVRVLVADDSALARELIASILSMDDRIRVVGEAANGKEAVEKVLELKPDIVTMDVEMPVMGGIEAIELIMAENPVPILVVTSRSDAHTAYTAVSKGALDLIQKPEVGPDCASEFVHKIKLLSEIKVISHIMSGGTRSERPKEKTAAPRIFASDGDRIVAIASSTGGPQALSVILSGLPEEFPWPIVVAQHIPEGFINGLLDFLRKSVKLPMKVGQRSERLRPGTVYLSPPEAHMEVDGSKKIALVERRKADIYRPSCDILFASVAREYRDRGIGIILTGMGDDGAAGMKKIKEAGGLTIAQNEETSVVFGMNKAAIDGGGAGKVLALERIAAEVMRAACA